MILRPFSVILSSIFYLFPISLSAQEASNLDIEFFRQINNRESDHYGLFEFVDQTSVPLLVTIPAGLLLYGALADDRTTFDTGILMAIAQSVTLGSTALLKAATNRPRPFEVLDNVKVKRLSSVSGSSFPSGHAAEAFAVATILALRSKPVAYVPAFLWAGLIGYGRVYLGVHYPTDVLGGIAVGAILSVVVFKYRDEIVKTIDRLLNIQPANRQLMIGSVENTPIVSLRIPLH